MSNDEEEDDDPQMSALGLHTPAQSIVSPDSIVSPHTTDMGTHIQVRTDDTHNAFSGYSHMRQLPPTPEESAYASSSYFATTSQASYDPRPQTSGFHPSALVLHEPPRRSS